MGEITIGGERLGSGKKMKAYLHNYERSSHDLSYVWRSTMSAGTLVPFMSEVALPGDTFDINLNADIMTHPTTGPLFGSYKVQLDVFQVPVRLYQAKLHMNMLNIGRDMSKIKLPRVRLDADNVNSENIGSLDNEQINPSCILSYLGIRGLGQHQDDQATQVTRDFNAIPYIGYWDIYKNYYANKSEEIGAVIHKAINVEAPTLIGATFENVIANDGFGPEEVPVVGLPNYENITLTSESTLKIKCVDVSWDYDAKNGILLDTFRSNNTYMKVKLGTIFNNVNIDGNNGTITCTGVNNNGIMEALTQVGLVSAQNTTNANINAAPTIRTFPLTNIDDMREDLLKHFSDSAFTIDKTTYAPFGLPMKEHNDGVNIIYSKKFSQEGLALKTYNSDLFNNWISTEWIDGDNGVSAVTAIDTSGGSFTLDELNLSQKIYNMLNRIAVSGGSYDDWLDAVYTHDRQRGAENPMYMGGLIKELVFQEVISQTPTEEKPLGTIAGRGRLSGKHKGGKIVIKCDEPSYIIGIISLTPRLDYSQGNHWATNLQSMNDFHKPALDEIGYQDLITDQMAWWDTQLSGAGVPTFKSAGKQPAWINYMTNVNKTYGNFAIDGDEMFMTLNRRYEAYGDESKYLQIKDLTTYIDPSKFNNVFALTSLDAQNFWAQIGVDITARRKMSAKIIPNL